MQLKVYDEIHDFDVDTISLDDYDLENGGEFLIEVLLDIIDCYIESLEDPEE